MKTLARLLSTLALALALAQVASAGGEFEVGQRNKAFEPVHLTIHAGDTVRFVNHDPFVHNIFSLTEAKPFDLGSYPRGEERRVTFDRPGEYLVECAIHPFMKMQIDVGE